MASHPYTLGFSPCPNDTFIFHALVHGLLSHDTPRYAPPELADVETLNEWAFDGRLDVTKLSFHAYGHVADRYVLLSAGSALGRGCGPLLVARTGLDQPVLPDCTIAIPGRYTTAALLLKLFAPACTNLVAMRFDQIMPAVASGAVDAGVIIHESRFTYPQHGLRLVQDLGHWWEAATGLPIPLGGIAARRSLGNAVISAIDRAVRASVRMAFDGPQAAMSYIRQHAQELDDAVISSHIGLYVTAFSEDLGPEGRAAVDAFLRRGVATGVLPPLPDLPLVVSVETA
ncbi:MAG TPA: 1,4-dihydroxy-6-naphthoate synthase [Desulfurivibrionaceae bacterium]|nr:1,4-dihydroxy-6-naphthoate synthase [Desulfurivibrionaceae bacterium]